jgi:hypothetical protein
MEKIISNNEIRYLENLSVDLTGRVFKWNGRIFRAIENTALDETIELFGCGLIERLQRERLIPKAWISDMTLEGYSLLIEHERIPVVTYPYEWSFSMLKDAAKLVLKLSIIAKEYNYELKDCHGLNVLFDSSSNPVFVDLGSIEKRHNNSKGWKAYEEFIRYYLYTLMIWSSGDSYLAKKIIFDNGFVPHHVFYFYFFPFLRIIKPLRHIIDRLALFYYKFRLFSSYPKEFILQNVPPNFHNVVLFIFGLKQRSLLPLQSINLFKVLKKIEKIKVRNTVSIWGDYQDHFTGKDGVCNYSQRFERILTIINNTDISNILELGGNQGVLSRLLSQNEKINKIICTDMDENAVDKLYLNINSVNEQIKIQPAILNFVSPSLIWPHSHPSERFRSDLVIMLAVMHHLLLKPPFFNVDGILDIVSTYSQKYVMVEFMPLGLHNGESAPELPSWYTVEWFREHFSTSFELLLEEQLEENRILFFGKKK